MTTDKVYVYYNENVYRLTHEKLADITLLLHVAVANRKSNDYVTGWSQFTSDSQIT